MNAASVSDESLWAVTAYFNPQRYQRRSLNYRLFRRYLNVPLLAVELSSDGHFELAGSDADILISLVSADVMWQKERLLNIAIQALPPACKNVVWIDCDTILCADDWPGRVSRALDDYPLVQPFSRVSHQSCEAHLGDPRDPAASEFWQISIPLAVEAGREPIDCLSGVRDRLDGSCVMGMAWAMRRDLVAALGIYDAGIVDGGTRPLVAAAYGCFDEAVRLNQFNDRQAAHYREWAEPFFAAVAGRAGAVEGDAAHLWHGNMPDRRYKERYQGLEPFHFDPYSDIAHDAGGPWRWSSPKPRLHQYVNDYFAARKEDG